MKRAGLIIGFIAAGLAAAFLFFRAAPSVTIETATGARHTFTVEMAITPEEQERGLMFRDRLPADHGMLFDFQEPRVVSFWMKNTLIPLDMIFIAEDGIIARIHPSAIPGSLDPVSSEASVRWVLEIPGGEAARRGLLPGDRAFIQ